jgi:hypothetical protein
MGQQFCNGAFEGCSLEQATRLCKPSLELEEWPRLKKWLRMELISGRMAGGDFEYF